MLANGGWDLIKRLKGWKHKWKKPADRNVGQKEAEKKLKYVQELKYRGYSECKDEMSD